MNIEGQRPSHGSLAPRRVPEAYVRAEVACFPLTSLGAFQSALTELVPSLDAEEGDATRRLWRECEKGLSEHASGWSLDRLISVRDAFWFASRGHLSGRRAPPRSMPMFHYLRHLADTHGMQSHCMADFAPSPVTASASASAIASPAVPGVQDPS